MTLRRLRYSIACKIAPYLSAFSEWETRPMIKFIMDDQREDNNIKTFREDWIDDKLLGVEIGVGSGYNAENILENLNIGMLYLVDPYVVYFDDVNGKMTKIEQYADKYNEAQNRLYKYCDKVIWVIKSSDKAVDNIPDNLDFVYIDGNHTYEYVKRDIGNYYPKLRKGGIIGGDNFYIGFIGVIRAVLEFIDKNQLKLHGKGNDWWVVK